MGIIIRPAKAGEAGLIHGLMRELADYEKLLDVFHVTEADMDEVLFGPQPRAHCDIAEWEGAPAGFALWYYSFPSFMGRPGIWLEDLFVKPAMRGKGLGLALLANLAARAKREKLVRVAWNVLDWNEPSIRFYDAIGGEPKTGWIEYGLTGDALADLAEKADGADKAV